MRKSLYCFVKQDKRCCCRTPRGPPEAGRASSVAISALAISPRDLVVVPPSSRDPTVAVDQSPEDGAGAGVTAGSEVLEDTGEPQRNMHEMEKDSPPGREQFMGQEDPIAARVI